MTQNGRVVWHDCITTDVDAALDFYGKLFGWTAQDFQTSPDAPPYKMIMAGEAGIGGIMAKDDNDPSPSCWMSYIAVDDVDAAAERAGAGGGEVIMPPTEIPTVGKFAIIKDPTGGVVAPFWSANDPDPEHENGAPVNHFIWEELLCTDPAKANAFYGEVFGWQTEQMDMGEMGTYRVLKRGEISEAGIMQKPADSPGPSHWLSYVHVDDVDASAAQVVELGGKTFVEPMTIPNVGRMSVHADPTGAMFALYKPGG